MGTGLLWFDDSEKGLRAKVTAGAGRYYKKFGAYPNSCHVNPLSLKSKKTFTINGRKIEVVPARNIQPDHFWIFVSEARG